jgi:hypothetical protein
MIFEWIFLHFKPTYPFKKSLHNYNKVMICIQYIYRSPFDTFLNIIIFHGTKFVIYFLEFDNCQPIKCIINLEIIALNHN